VVALVGGPWRGGTAPGPNPADDGPPVTGELVLTVWSRDGRKAGRRIGADAEALPVLAGEEVHAQARFDRPAFAYLLRIDPAGTAAPLWPWTAGPAAAALADPPPVLGPVEEVHSPADPRRGWPAGGRSGLETVVLLARRSPLPAEVSLAALVERLPPAKLRRPQEAGLFGTGLPGPAEVIPAGELSAADIALGQLLGRLREHFDLVRAQRYAIWGH
jgi:hypothetical protein